MEIEKERIPLSFVLFSLLYFPDDTTKRNETILRYGMLEIDFIAFLLTYSMYQLADHAMVSDSLEKGEPVSTIERIVTHSSR